MTLHLILVTWSPYFTHLAIVFLLVVLRSLYGAWDSKIIKDWGVWRCYKASWELANTPTSNPRCKLKGFNQCKSGKTCCCQHQNVGDCWTYDETIQEYLRRITYDLVDGNQVLRNLSLRQCLEIVLEERLATDQNRAQFNWSIGQ